MVMGGTKSDPWMRNAQRAIAANLSNATHAELAAKLPQGDAAVTLKKGAPITSMLPPQQEKPQIEKSATAPISSEEIFRVSP